MYADVGGVGCAVTDVFLIGGVIEKRGDELNRMVIAVIGAEVAEEAVGYGMVVAGSAVSGGADYILS